MLPNKYKSFNPNLLTLLNNIEKVFKNAADNLIVIPTKNNEFNTLYLIILCIILIFMGLMILLKIVEQIGDKYFYKVYGI